MPRIFTVVIVAAALFSLAGCFNPATPSLNESGDITYKIDGSSITIVGLANQNSTEIVIPPMIQDKTVTTIGRAAFKASRLVKVTIPNSVTTIEDEAFHLAASLKEVHIGTGITSIGNQAFAGTALNRLTILATQPPELSGSNPAAVFPSSLIETTLEYPIAGTNFGSAPWSDFGSKITILDSDAIETVRAGDGSIAITLKGIAGVIYTASAHEQADFSDTGIEATSEAATEASLILIVGNLDNTKPYHIRVQGKNVDGDSSNWIAAAENPYTLSSEATPAITGVQTGLDSLTVTVNALTGIDITVEAHSNADFTDLISTITETATGSDQELTLTGLTSGTAYHIRAQGVNTQGNPSEWVAASANPYMTNKDPSLTLGDDVQAGGGTLTVTVNALAGIVITLEAHSNVDFTDLITTVTQAATGSDQELTLTGLTGGTDYYIRAQGANTQGNLSEWVAASTNPYTPNADPTVSDLRVESFLETIVAKFRAVSGITVTVYLHTSADFSDTGTQKEFTATGDIDEVRFDSLTSGTSYYIRAQGANDQMDQSDWLEASANPYIPSTLYLRDAIPGNGMITAKVESSLSAAGKVEVSTTLDFTDIAKAVAFTGTGSVQDVVVDTLINGTSYYLRASLDSSTVKQDYTTPLIPTDGTTRYIHRLSELAKIGVDEINYPANGTYALKANLDFSDANNDGTADDPFDTDDTEVNGNWAPLTPGNFDAAGNLLDGAFQGSFSGTSDSGPYTITGMIINLPEVSRVGFFSALNNGNIHDIGLLEVMVTGNSDVGALLGLCEGDYTGISLSGNYSSGSVIGHGQFVGGLVGNLQSGTIRASHSDSDVTGKADHVGGLTGNSEGYIIDSYATGDVLGEGQHVGGLIGYLKQNDTSGHQVSNSYATGDVTGEETVGGLIGEAWSPHALLTFGVQNCYATGDVTGGTNGKEIGGLIGFNSVTLLNSYAIGNVSGASDVGGLVGANQESIKYSFATGDVSGSTSVGGLLGNITMDPTSNLPLGSTTDSYRYSGQTITITTNAAPTEEGGIVSLVQLKDQTWYSTSLQWQEDDWHISDLVDATPSVYPHVYLKDGSKVEVANQPNVLIP